MFDEYASLLFVVCFFGVPPAFFTLFTPAKLKVSTFAFTGTLFCVLLALVVFDVVVLAGVFVVVLPLFLLDATPP